MIVIARGVTVDATQTVNDALRRWPAAVTPLAEFGIDTCCGGAATLEQAAEEANVSLPDLLTAIAHAVGSKSAVGART